MKMRLNSCCCCINVRTGAGIIGALQILGSGKELVEAIGRQTIIHQLKSTEDPDERQELFQVLRSTFTSLRSLDELVSFVQMLQNYLFFSALVGLLTAILLCCGLLQKQPKLIVVYLVVNLISYFVAIFITIFAFIYSGMIVSDYLMVMVIAFSLPLYFLLVVYSAYLDIQKAELESQNRAVVVYTSA